MPVVKVEFVRERDTKNTVRYLEVIEPNGVPKIGTLYVQKPTVEEFKLGDRIVVTFENVK